MRRYEQLVTEHLHVSEHLASGLRASPETASVFASTQAAWRFYKNDQTSLESLCAPLLEAAHREINEHCERYVLAVHDWSHLNYNSHESKQDRIPMTNRDQGYELQSTLLLSDRRGVPLAPVAQNLRNADGLLSSYHSTIIPPQPHLDELNDRIQWLSEQRFSLPLVHLIDREADSAAHLRAWEKENWLIRANHHSRVRYQGEVLPLKTVAEKLSYHYAREVLFKGGPALQWVAETEVLLERDAKPKRFHQGKRVGTIPGKTLTLRLVVSRVLDEKGQLLAQWLLLSNLPEVPAQRIALWYYWRWQIESFFKLLKQAGHHLEDWQQESGLAIAKRLLIASMACVLVWRIAHSQQQDAEETRRFLVRLSGRQMKKSKPVTYSAMLDGLWIFLSMLDILNHYPSDQILTFERFIRNTQLPP